MKSVSAVGAILAPWVIISWFQWQESHNLPPGGRLLRAGVPWEFPRAQGLPHHLRCLLWPRCCVHLLPRRPRGLRSPWRLWRCAADQETPEALVQLCWRWLGTWQWFSQAARVIHIIYYSHVLLPTTISSISSSDRSSCPDQSGKIKVMSCLQYASCCANKNISSSSISNIHLATISSSCSCAKRYCPAYIVCFSRMWNTCYIEEIQVLLFLSFWYYH